jgi:tetratricopeptide (TPR) repeat protein
LALDREDTLKKAEKLLRQGRLDGAIAEYVRVVEDQPRDWNTANTLGDLYVRAGQSDKAVAQYARIADHFFQDGFYPKAAALFKKILKISPDDESSQLRLAELSGKQGLLRDAKFYYNAVAKRRTARGDVRGAGEIIVRLGDLDPADIDARRAAAKFLIDSGDDALAAQKLRLLHDDLLEKGRMAEALDALREAVRCDPTDLKSRAILAKEAVAAGDIETARGFLDRDTASGDPSLLMALLDIELRSGDLEQAEAILSDVLGSSPEQRDTVLGLAWTLAGSNPDAAFVCVDAVANGWIADSAFEQAATALQEFVKRVPAQIPALLKLVEVCVDGGLEATMYETQTQLADAYLEGGHAAEARVIAEDLVAREPWERAHIERFRRALVMLRVAEPDSVIAERLSGQSPFRATDHFSDPPMPDPPREEPVPAPAAVEARAAVEPPPVPPAVAAPQPAAHGKSQELAEIDLTGLLGQLESPSAPAAAALPAPPSPAAPAANLDEVFRDFRTEVSRQAGVDQSAQHMKLAETYLEMGMTEEAVTALETAAKSPRQRFEAGSILGRIYRERGNVAAAIEWLERAAEAPAPSVERGRALLYDLGGALQAAGETTRALTVFLELQADAGDYRDVPARIDHLARAQSGG